MLLESFVKGLPYKTEITKDALVFVLDDLAKLIILEKKKWKRMPNGSETRTALLNLMSAWYCISNTNLVEYFYSII